MFRRQQRSTRTDTLMPYTTLVRSKPVLAFLREHEGQLRRPRLLVPAAELRQVDVPALLHRAHEILASRRLAVVAREIKVGALAEPLGPKQRRHHPDDLGARVIDGRWEEHTSDLQ